MLIWTFQRSFNGIIITATRQFRASSIEAVSFTDEVAHKVATKLDTIRPIYGIPSFFCRTEC